MTTALVQTLVAWAFVALALVLLFVGVAVLVAVLDNRQKAAERRTYREADFWRTAHAPKPEPRKRV